MHSETLPQKEKRKGGSLCPDDLLMTSLFLLPKTKKGQGLLRGILVIVDILKLIFILSLVMSIVYGCV